MGRVARIGRGSRGRPHVQGSTGSTGGGAPAGLYVDWVNGSDSTGLGTFANPYKTIGFGASHLSAGNSTLFARAGTYDEVLSSGIPSGSTWSAMTRIAAYNNETVTVAPSAADFVLWLRQGEHYIEFDGIDFDASAANFGCVKIETNSTTDTHHIRIKAGALTSSPVPAGAFSAIVYVIGVSSVATGGNEFIDLTLRKAAGQTDTGGSPTNTIVDGIYLQTPRNLVQGCNFSGLYGFGVQTYNGNTPGSLPSSNTIRYNVVQDFVSTLTKTQGIVIAMGNNNRVYGNLVFNLTSGIPGSKGIYLADGNNTEMYNNTISSVANGGVLIDVGTGLIVQNNISYSNAGGNYSNGGGTGTIDHNSWDSTSNGGFNGADPLFVNPSLGNYQLSSNSPAVDKGVTISTVTTDLNGVTRPVGAAYDIGCYESF